jgi:hypothetical protein
MPEFHARPRTLRSRPCFAGNNAPASRRVFLRRLAKFGLGTAIALPLLAIQKVASARATPGGGEASTRVSAFIGANGSSTYDVAIAAAIADAVLHSHKLVDFEGLSYVTTSTVVISDDGVTLVNGGIRPNGKFPALSVDADDVTVRNMVFSRSTDADLLATTPDRCCVVVSGKRFTSLDCDYLGANLSCLYLANGRCDGTVVKGGQMTSGSARQNSSGVYAANGRVGHRNLTIDGVYIHDSTMGVSLIDASDCLVTNCRIERMRVLPTIALTRWVQVAGDVWRTRTAHGVPGVDGTVNDREAGSTNVVTVDGIKLGGVYDSSDPATNAASQADGYVYINLGGDDPNTKSITSGIVSGYAYVIYTLEATCERNRFIGNLADDCDGFGIYFQLGQNGNGIGRNQAIGNSLRNVCMAGRQSLSLPFAAIGVAGGSETLLEGNTIDGVGSATGRAPGVHVIPSSLFPGTSGQGKIVGTTVSNGTESGFYINSSDWTLTDCHAHQNANAGFMIGTISKNAVVEGVALARCTASNNGGDGIFVNGNNSTISRVSVQLIGGESRNNALSGVVLSGAPGDTVQDSVITGMTVSDNGGPQVWVRAGCARTTVSECFIASATAGAVGLLVDGAAVGTRVSSNRFSLVSG